MAGPAVVLDHLRRKIAAGPLAALDDRSLLERYASGGPDAELAFEVIVRRHGPMVRRVCLVALGDAHADDAFQATFLVLVRRRNAVRREISLGPWLFGVARRVCAGARSGAARRARHEARVAIRASAVSVDNDAADKDMATIVYAEVGRLPAALRSGVVLCDLAGLTYAEAADRLGLSHAAMRGRLARARQRLRQRLQRRGIGPEVIWVSPVVVPAALAQATARAAMVVAGQAAGTVSAPVTALLVGGLESMIWTKCKTAGLSALTAGVLLAGAVGLSARQQPTIPTAQEPAYRDALVVIDNALADRGDPSEEVEALVRRAERQQDRADPAGALKTLGELDSATRRWRDRLKIDVDRKRDADDTGTSPVPRRPGGSTFGSRTSSGGSGSSVNGSTAPVPNR
jgi:RNA polymerase sigma factor (sigma-70 family)